MHAAAMQMVLFFDKMNQWHRLPAVFLGLLYLVARRRLHQQYNLVNVGRTSTGDASAIYGNNAVDLKKVRTSKDGKLKLYGLLGKKFKDMFGHIGRGFMLSGYLGMKKPENHGMPYSLTEGICESLSNASTFT
ncbi:hypothetical protein FXO38_17728 [Capsicum annuum]|nr:hypothetical protein FXO38_17728 [Capsicum annuum]